ncbi:hypothetical protein ALO86_102317 [Pseudomonas syringae pv. berberidis]|nr:hypothetical protein ALO87_102623 [Pseudomonas syringae pv. apii]KPW51380.1 hypothetical protein ALO86_102317 [Pseudomonas syringae pv. berberidis]RMM08926.1 hypothetical protein ALQ85_102665 [Pseudomonas syringae]RMO79646.1 hypothetical protein ALQ34_103707 [Pseudomonas syringae pv. maculicola]RMP34699.1 hypothetical protein ALQ23_102591 [Pseudomonas syringae pv. antirrhini]
MFTAQGTFSPLGDSLKRTKVSKVPAPFPARLRHTLHRHAIAVEKHFVGSNCEQGLRLFCKGDF